jgi:hypothetical protein
MAIIGFAEIWDPRDAGVHGRFVRDYQRSFKYQTDAATDSQLQILLYPLTPRLFTPYAGQDGFVDLGAICYQVDAAQDEDDPFFWKATAHYSSDLSHIAEMADKGSTNPLSGNSIGGRGAQGFENPLLRPPKIKWGQAKFQKAVTQDTNGDPIVNSALERFDPPVEIDDSRPTLEITRNEPTYQQALAMKYRDAVNSDPFFGFGIGTVKVDSITADFRWENGYGYWEVSYVFHIRPEKWNPTEILDCGFYHLDAAGKPAAIRDAVGSNLSAPVLLDGKGQQLQPGAKPVFIPFDFYEIQPFADLHLP